MEEKKRMFSYNFKGLTVCGDLYYMVRDHLIIKSIIYYELIRLLNIDDLVC